MRLTLATRHRRIVILTGDDTEDTELVVNLTSADLTPADDDSDDYEPEDTFGFTPRRR